MHTDFICTILKVATLCMMLWFGVAKPAVSIFPWFHDDLDCIMAQSKLGMSQCWNIYTDVYTEFHM